jgi:hypothetical protein
VVAELSQPWAPFLSGISVFANPIRPANFGGKSESDFFAHPEKASTAIGAPPYQRSGLDHPQMLKLPGKLPKVIPGRRPRGAAI